MRRNYYSRSAKRRAKKSSRNFIITLILIGVLIYATLQWILPSVIGGVSLINGSLKPVKKAAPVNYESLAPPVLNIPFEATNSSQINITGYATPDADVKLYLDDKLQDTARASGDGQFQFTNIPLSLGTNNFYGKTADEKGVESLPSKTLTVFFENEKPSLTIYGPEDGKTIQGGDKKITITGKTDPDISVYINDTRIITSSDGTFSSDQQLNDGDNNFTIKAIDKAGNEADLARKVTFKS